MYSHVTHITISTLNGSSQVHVYKWISDDWTSKTKSDILDFYQVKYNNKLVLEDSATVKYNCHAWAWTGRTDICMNQLREENYFTDLSYLPKTNTSIAKKVYYGGFRLGDDYDHSANTTSTSGYFSSK